MARYAYLEREEILKYIDTLHFRTQYVRIIILDKQECPLRAIEGRATAGSITINGSSAVRRSGSLTLVTAVPPKFVENPLDIMNEVTNIDTLISMNKRVQLEMGIKNSGNQYTQYDIFWIPLGTFIISNASVTYNNQGISINLKLTDKMALLNGELGGTFSSALKHSPSGWYEYKKGEELATIVSEGVRIRDLIEGLVHSYGELQPYEYIIEDIPLEVNNIICWTKEGYFLKQDGDVYSIVKEKPNEVPAGVRIYDFNEAVGYTFTDFVYPLDKDLDSKAGETVASVLEKIKNTLGNYEYFFDVNGIFHFRQIRNFLNEGSDIDNLTDAIAEKYFINVDSSKAIYSFNDAALITSYSNNPQYGQIKNDYSVWGERKIAGGIPVPLQYHLTLQEAPQDYEDQYWLVTIDTKTGKVFQAETMTSAQNKYFLSPIENNNLIGTSLAQYYVNFSAIAQESKNTTWRFKIYFKTFTKPSSRLTPFDKELQEKMPKLFDFSCKSSLDTFPLLVTKNNADYWFDIINTKDERLKNTINVQQFGIENIGRKTKTLEDDEVNCLFMSDVPDNHFDDDIDYVFEIEDNSAIIEDDNKLRFWDCVSLGAIENPAYDLLRSSLHEHLSYNNNISITAMPVYHLDVNQRITVNNKESDIHGDYIINSLTIPLTLNGMMTINARQAVERI